MGEELFHVFPQLVGIRPFGIRVIRQANLLRSRANIRRRAIYSEYGFRLPKNQPAAPKDPIPVENKWVSTFRSTAVHEVTESTGSHDLIQWVSTI
jgi:hypothetical protein